MQAQVVRTVPANGSLADVLQGSPVRNVTTAQIMQMGIVSAQGAAIGDITAEVISGGRSIATGFAADVEAVAGDGVVADKNVKITAGVVPSDQVLVNLTNTTIGAIVVIVFVNLPMQ